MYLQRETNPHFISPPFSPTPPTPRSPTHSPPRRTRSQRPKRTAPRHGTAITLVPEPRDRQLPSADGMPRPHSPHLQTKERQHEHEQPSPQPRLYPGYKHPTHDSPPQQTQQHPGTQHPGQHGLPQQHPVGGRHHLHQQHGRHQQRPSSLRVPSARKTNPIAWLIAALCTLFWIIIIVGGLAILIIYLVFKPRLPKFDISGATLNAAYLDMGYLLNADLTLLANFTNPNKKVNVDFNYVVLNLYHDRNFIATRYVAPFTAMRKQSMFQDVHMITSQVPLSLHHSQELNRQIENGRVMLEIKGYFRATSKLGGFLRYSYWLYGHCTITVTAPPAGVIIGKRCTTKR